MAGRGRISPDQERRDQRTVVRWTKSEKERINKAQKAMDLTYEVDVIRLLTLRQLELMGFPEE